jgi:hypothetical protein
MNKIYQEQAEWFLSIAEEFPEHSHRWVRACIHFYVLAIGE